MRITFARSALLATAAVLLALACVDEGAAPCEGAECDAADAGSEDAGVADAGPTPGKCTPACSGARPTCRFETGECVVCTATRGCDLPSAPYCDTTVAEGRCVGCLRDDQCPGTKCDPATHSCGATDGGTPDAGTPDGGSSSGCNPTLECDPPCDPAETCIAGLCKARVGCVTECDQGFRCEQGQCVLNGGGGPIQVTLRWKGPVDVDLHLLDPNNAETYYGEQNRPGDPSYDANRASLDLDSNAGCAIDNINIENMIFDAAAQPPAGTYKVRVDYFEACAVTNKIGYEVIVRVNGVESGYCGLFSPNDADQGQAGSGRQVATFQYP